RDIADRAVDHIALGFAPPRDVLHDLTDQCARLVAAAIDHDDVARPDQLERAMDREIVARPRAHGEGGADELAAAMERPQPDRPRQTAEIVGNHRRRRAPKALDQSGWRFRYAGCGNGDGHAVWSFSDFLQSACSRAVDGMMRNGRPSFNHAAR